jgi:signal transduction histidine kinase
VRADTADLEQRVRRGAPRLALLPVAAVQVGASFGAAQNQPEATDLDAGGVALLLLGPLSIAALWRRPVLSLWVALAISAGYLAAGYPYGPFVLTPTIALVRAVVTGHRHAAWVGGAVGVAAGLAAHRVSPSDQNISWGQLIGLLTWVVIVLVAAEIIKANRERRVQAALAASELGRRRASEERMRIAQELHDVLAHNISLINVQAGVGLHLMDSKPEQARDALASIKSASREALVELRAALDLLRNGATAPRAPTSGLDQLDGLVDRVRSPDLDVRLERTGTARVVPPGVDLAAFRIAQEALTNVVRHATGARRATVRLEYGADELTVQVDDDGHAVIRDDEQHGGTGIDGMRARAAALSGHLDAGPRPGGGFRVRARLPLGPAASDAPAEATT